MFALPGVKRWITLNIVMPNEAWYDQVSTPGGKPEWNGRKVYFQDNNKLIEDNPVIWFSGMAGQAGTSNDILEYFSQPGGQDVPPFGILYYNQQQPAPGITPLPGIEYPSINTIPLTLTLVNKQGVTLVENLPYSWNLSRLVQWPTPNSRKGFADLTYSLKDIDLQSSYVTITGNGLDLQLSAVNAIFDPVYRGPYYLFVTFAI